MSGCPYCPGDCRGADLDPLLTAPLGWLWEAVAAAADRRGDPALAAGRLTVTAPAEPAARAAAVGLLGGAPLRAGARRSVDLAALTARLTTRGGALTPGAVAAHAVRRPLAQRAAARRDRDTLLLALRAALAAHAAGLPGHVAERVDAERGWQRLRASGWTARLAGRPDPEALLAQAVAVLAALPAPPRRADRRTLVAADPHALDDGTPLAGLVLALAGLAGTRARPAWDALGVDCDDLTGGLLVLGVQPAGWTVPGDAVVTVPPRELARTRWPAPPAARAWVFVTENPSVVAAAAAAAAGAPAGSVRLVCTVGTPSALEAAAVAGLADAGWRVAVRADFDRSGLAHVRALLAACPAATPWRMGAADYRRAVATTDVRPAAGPAAGPAADAAADHAADHVGGAPAITPADTPWDPALAAAMTAAGVPGFEEALLDVLLADLCAGRPGGGQE